MQAILLTELFTRFRGRKTVVRLTRHFEALYNRVSIVTTAFRPWADPPLASELLRPEPNNTAEQRKW